MTKPGKLGEETDLIEFLLNKGGDPNQKEDHFHRDYLPRSSYLKFEPAPVLCAEGHQGNLGVVLALLDRGADPNAPGEDLVCHTAKLKFEGGEYGTPLRGASQNGNENCARLLLERGAEVHAYGVDLCLRKLEH